MVFSYVGLNSLSDMLLSDAGSAGMSLRTARTAIVATNLIITTFAAPSPVVRAAAAAAAAAFPWVRKPRDYSCWNGAGSVAHTGEEQAQQRSRRV